MKRNTIVEIISYLLILLFVYAALSKLLDYQKFQVQLGKSPILTNYSGWIAWFIPAIEIGISVLLAIPYSRLTGFYASFSLMTLFTAYIIAITNFSRYIPCSCGGVLQNLSWKQHLWFNIGFVILSVTGILIYSNQPKIISKQN